MGAKVAFGYIVDESRGDRGEPHHRLKLTSARAMKVIISVETQYYAINPYLEIHQ